MTSEGRVQAPRRFKPAPPHNALLGPSMCLCVTCCRWVLDQRCPVTSAGQRCGNWKGHRPSREHTVLVATIFDIAEERVRLDAKTTPARVPSPEATP